MGQAGVTGDVRGQGGGGHAGTFLEWSGAIAGSNGGQAVPQRSQNFCVVLSGKPHWGQLNGTSIAPSSLQKLSDLNLWQMGQITVPPWPCGWRLRFGPIPPR